MTGLILTRVLYLLGYQIVLYCNDILSYSDGILLFLLLLLLLLSLLLLLWSLVCLFVNECYYEAMFGLFIVSDGETIGKD